MGRKIFAVAAAVLLLGGSTSAVAQNGAQEPQAQPPQPPDAPSTPGAPAPQGEEAPHPIEPILVQGEVKAVSNEQLTLTAPDAPVDLPLTLHQETRYIQGEKDVQRADVKEGQTVRAALLPVGEDLIALVVEVVPEEPQATPPGAQPGQDAPQQPAQPERGGDGLQGEAPPASPTPTEPAPVSPVPSAPEGDAQSGETAL